MINKNSKNPILFISAGLKDAKKGDNPFAKFHTYLNYGLLGLASILHQKGYNSKLYHGRFFEPESFSKFVIKHSNFVPEFPIFISLPSLFAIDWAKEFINDFKISFPETKIIVGGRWVVENDGAWIRNVLPNVDLVVFGTAEDRIESLLDFQNWSSINYTDISSVQIPESKITEYPIYDYEIMHDFNDFNPSIEVSRGCGLGCFFCLENSSPLLELKSPIQISQEIIKAIKIYNNINITPYFEASFFRPTIKWAKALKDSFEANNINIKWRAETRIDSITEQTLTILSETGLKVLDIGLESASITQIRRMNKSKKPDLYLEKASGFLKLCKKLDIWAKVNILLHAGEDQNTISETIEWLKIHKSYLKGVSVNSHMIYGHDEKTKKYLMELKIIGAVPLEGNIELKGYTKLHLSESISYEESENLRLSISKTFMNSKDYFDLKAFSYFPKSFTIDNFNEICMKSDQNKLPFHIDII